MGIAMVQKRITLSKLLEQPRDYQNRSHMYSALVFFSPVPHIDTWYKAAGAIFLALFYCIVIILFCIHLNSGNYYLVIHEACYAISMPLRLRELRRLLYGRG